MAIIKCKMCGGDLEIKEGLTVCTCEYCGTKQTVPSADNEKKLTLFARANRLRAACEFDKAAGVYESIVADFPKEAEAYWGLVLCRYGIEYVDDPATGKKVPTCHRSSFESVMADGDLKQACENADTIARQVYRGEAEQLEAIRKGIIEVSGKEEPYDIFICYKETTDNGERTIDSVIAQDVYDALTDKGYRVFFSRISLEDKLGTEYEPYIFAALNSAKLMLAFGTDYEHYNAVWVKNEWSRFLKLMAVDKSRHLIPCYKSIDAYDMPQEFAKLQAQDMGKVGAMQDLLRGIEKILPRGKAETAPVQPVSEGKVAVRKPVLYAAVAVIALIAVLFVGEMLGGLSGGSNYAVKGTRENITVEFPAGSNPDYERSKEIVYIDINKSGNVSVDLVRAAVPLATTSCFYTVRENLGSSLDPYIINSSTYAYLEDTDFESGLDGDSGTITDPKANYCLLLWKWRSGPMLAGYFVGVPEEGENGGYRIPVTLCEYEVANLRERAEAKSGAYSGTQNAITVEFPAGSDADYKRNKEIVYVDVSANGYVSPDLAQSAIPFCTTSYFYMVTEDLGNSLDPYIINSRTYAILEDEGFYNAGLNGDSGTISDPKANYCYLIWKWNDGRPCLAGYFVGIPEPGENGGYRLPVTLCQYDVTNLRERIERQSKP